MRDKEGRPFLDRNPDMFTLVSVFFFGVVLFKDPHLTPKLLCKILEFLRTDIWPAVLLPPEKVPFFEHEIDYFGLERPLPNTSLKVTFHQKRVLFYGDCSLQCDDDAEILLQSHAQS